MNYHLEQEVSLLKTRIAQQSNAVENAVRKTLNALMLRDGNLAREIIADDDALDMEDVRIEEECLKVLALHQPVARDLRYIITLLKVNTELERIGDFAVNIAERVQNITNRPSTTEPLDIEPMFQEIFLLLKNVLNAYMERDCYAASQVIAHDDVVDRMNRDNYHQILRQLNENRNGENKNSENSNSENKNGENKTTDTRNVEILLDYLNISRNLERIADCCTNIGEDVLYLEQGRIVRHAHDQL
ncbi:MAG: PhoU domain-containing protein [Planctomycetia bacterium]|nr:PhoU domain-containing protein [Planctomycetia bacterium]